MPGAKNPDLVKNARPVCVTRAIRGANFDYGTLAGGDTDNKQPEAKIERAGPPKVLILCVFFRAASTTAAAPAQAYTRRRCARTRACSPPPRNARRVSRNMMCAGLAFDFYGHWPGGSCAS